MRLIRLILSSAVAAACTAASLAAKPGAYKGAIATDAETGAVLFEDNADSISPPASMTKLMSYAVLDDAIQKGTIKLSTPVTVNAATARVAMMKDSTLVWLRQGETFTVEELIYAMMIQSANDAAYAIACQTCGTVGAFVAQMNVKARELGMRNSTFRTPNGFPPPSRRISEGDLTTPRDYALLCRYLLQHTDILKYTSVKTRPFGAGVRLQPVIMNNHNHLLGRIPGVDGLKTGFTSGAGFCLSATAARNGHRVIVVMMDSPDPKTRDLNVRDLIDEAFMRVPISEGPFSRGGSAPAAPGKAATPASPTRPSPTPVPTPDEGPVIHLPGSGR